MKRFAVLHAPDFHLQSILRHATQVAGRPAALVDAQTRKARITELNALARSAHVEVGMSPTQALARCSALQLITANAGHERSPQDALLQTAETLSPLLEATAPTPDLAMLAARFASPVLIVDSSSAFLAPLPIEALEPSGELSGILHSWGIRTIGQLVGLAALLGTGRVGTPELESSAHPDAFHLKPYDANAAAVIVTDDPLNVFVELQRHRVINQERIVEGLLDLAQAHRIPVVATNGVLYAEPWGRDVLDVLTCIRHHTHLDAAGLILALNAQRHLKTPKERARLFADIPEATINTERIAERLQFSLEDLGYAFPDFPVSSGETMDSQLRKLTYFGAQQRYGSISGTVREQLEKELALISKLKFCGYFLIVWDIVNFAREEGILVQGRGSAANSAVCYALGITAVDPVGGKLQHLEGVVSVLAKDVRGLNAPAIIGGQSYDFH